MSHAMTLPSVLSPSSAKAAPAGALALSHSSLLPGQLGNIDAYIQAVNRIPMLTPAEERQFATEFRIFIEGQHYCFLNCTVGMAQGEKVPHTVGF